MTYSVKEIFYTLQGEGAQTGRPAVFCRFSGCNLWSGREQDRSRAVCNFCDTDFIGTDGINGAKFKNAESLAQSVFDQWPKTNNLNSKPYVVCTGGEPLLQLDEVLIDAFHQQGFEIAVETNGTCKVPPGIDWVCVSPKAGSELIVHRGNELKLVYPQFNANPKSFTDLDFDYFFLQPMDSPERLQNTQKTLDYCLKHPQWRLSLQSHKVLGIP
jgi:7-carboxy-7-deazaguanine synthase